MQLLRLAFWQLRTQNTADQLLIDEWQSTPAHIDAQDWIEPAHAGGPQMKTKKQELQRSSHSHSARK